MFLYGSTTHRATPEAPAALIDLSVAGVNDRLKRFLDEIGGFDSLPPVFYLQQDIWGLQVSV